MQGKCKCEYKRNFKCKDKGKNDIFYFSVDKIKLCAPNRKARMNLRFFQ